ncbi:hypothetical protein L0Y59_03675 [Candidatus Uhrbacteria bacterium]|nr:hypothetical protein [Candidatus Uhrbacteria bacterium]
MDIRNVVLSGIRLHDKVIPDSLCYCLTFSERRGHAFIPNLDIYFRYRQSAWCVEEPDASLTFPEPLPMDRLPLRLAVDLDVIRVIYRDEGKEFFMGTLLEHLLPPRSRLRLLRKGDRLAIRLRIGTFTTELRRPLSDFPCFEPVP